MRASHGVLKPAAREFLYYEVKIVRRQFVLLFGQNLT